MREYMSSRINITVSGTAPTVQNACVQLHPHGCSLWSPVSSTEPLSTYILLHAQRLGHAAGGRGLNC